MPDLNQLRNALSDIAWDAQSGWIGNDGVDSWTPERVKMTAKNIVDSLTNEEKGEK